MMRSLGSLGLVALVLLVAAQGAPLRAQTASEHFPNDDGGANVQSAGTMDLTVKQQGLHSVKTSAVGGVALSVAELGQDVAIGAINKLCEAAIGNGLFCDGTKGSGAGSVACSGTTAPNWCCNATANGTSNYDCDDTNGAGGAGFTLTRINTQVSFTVSPTATGGKIQALNCTTSSGNTHGADLLERVLVRVKPNGVSGNVVFNVHHNQGGANPRTFTVTNASTLSDQALQDAITAGYNAMGLGLTAATRTAADAPQLSGARETFDGYFVAVNYSSDTLATLIDFEVDGQPGQTLTVETVCNTCIPTLSEWGMGILVGTVLLTGLWMLLRRQQLLPM